MRREPSDFLLPYWYGRVCLGAFPCGGLRAARYVRFEIEGLDVDRVLETIRQFLHRIYDVQGLIQWGGPLLVCIIVFIETGFFVGFFLPGDSLLVTAGVFAAAGQIPLHWLLAPVMLCAIVGDQIGYWIGRAAGASLYKRENSLIFRRSHLLRAHDFFEKYGGKAVILARFIPIIRTFCPPVAGAAKMPYSRYLAYDIFGGVLWVAATILGGYFLGRSVPNISQRIHYVIAVVILLSILPAVISIWRARRSGSGGSSRNTSANLSENESD